MSLTTVTPPKTYRLGIVASTALDDPDFLPELVGPHAAVISHLYSNGANPLVAAFAAAYGLSLTIFPITGGRCLPWSTTMILDNVDFVYIVADPESKSARWVISECERRHVKHRLIPFTPYTHYADKVERVAEILAATTKEQIEGNDTLKAIWREV